MNTNKFSVSIKWSPEDNCFIAQHPELPSVIAHGDSREEALRELGDAYQAYISSTPPSINPVYFTSAETNQDEPGIGIYEIFAAGWLPWP